MESAEKIKGQNKDCEDGKIMEECAYGYSQESLYNK
jgi:hypothetical protein